MVSKQGNHVLRIKPVMRVKLKMQDIGGKRMYTLLRDIIIHKLGDFVNENTRKLGRILANISPRKVRKNS